MMGLIALVTASSMDMAQHHSTLQRMLTQRKEWRAEARTLELLQVSPAPVTVGSAMDGASAAYVCKKIALPSDRGRSLMGTYHVLEGKPCRGNPSYTDRTTGLFLYYSREGFWVVYTQFCAMVFEQTYIADIAVVEGHKNGVRSIRLLPCESAQLL
jgi:hypothetical protein